MMMKKYLILLIMAVAVFVSCGQENLLPEDETVQVTPITFNLTANHPDATKAVKTGWEAGDAIFVFFSGAAAPKYLKMTYNGTGWTSTEMNGSLGLKNGDNGMMRAVFLPFGSDATVSASADGTSFVFSKTYYAYYLTATLPYEVQNNKVSGAFGMYIPEGYVQFFIEDGEAANGAYTLGTDAVIPVGVASIATDGTNVTITETSDKVAGNDMTGYVYDNGTDPKGYLFSGKLNDEYHSYQRSGDEIVDAHAYYFAKTKTADGSRADYFIQGKTLASYSAIKLPANGDAKWQAVGPGVCYELLHIIDAGTPQESAGSLGKWYTCNYDCSVPEQTGTLYTFDEANALPGVTLPTEAQFEILNTFGHAEWVWLSVHGQGGMVIKASNAFLFLPAQSVGAGYGYYWSSSVDGSEAIYFLVNDFLAHGTDPHHPSQQHAVRPFQN